MQRNTNFKSYILLSLFVIVICFALYFCNPLIFWNDDYQSYYTPIFHDIGRALSHGEFPLLSPWSWFGGNLTGEYQSGNFSVFEFPLYWIIYQFNVSMPLLAALLTIIHLIIMSLGMFAIGRQRKLTDSCSAFAAIAATFSGWLFLWGAINWYPALSGVIWIPWLWWSLEKILMGNRSVDKVVLPALFLYLIFTSGWHYAIFMGGIISIWICLKDFYFKKNLKTLRLIFFSWLIGLGLSAPAWLSLWEYSRYTVRMISNIDNVDYTKWSVPFSALIGMIQPAFPSIWQTWDGTFNPRVSWELANGILPVIFIGMSIYYSKIEFIKKHIPEFLLALIALILAILPGGFGFRWSFRWLPLFHIVIAIISAEALNFLLQQKVIISYKLPLVSIICFTTFSTVGILYDFGLKLLIENLYILIILVLFLYGLLLQVIKQNTIAPISVFILGVIIFLTYAIIPDNLYPKWNFTNSLLSNGPLNKQIRYLSIYSPEDFYSKSNKFDYKFGDYLKPADLPMLSEIECIQGYSPQRHFGLTELFSFGWAGQILNRSRIEKIIKNESGPNGLLALMDVNGIVLSESYGNQAKFLEKNGWEITSRSNIDFLDHAIVLVRKEQTNLRARTIKGNIEVSRQDVIHTEMINKLTQNYSLPLPVFLFDPQQHNDNILVKKFSNAEVRTIKEERNKTVLHVINKSTNQNALVLISRAWYPGFKAKLNQRTLPVKVIDMIMPAVEIPAGVSGTLTVYYFPNSILIGLFLTGVSLLTCVLLMIWEKISRNKHYSRQKGYIL